MWTREPRGRPTWTENDVAGGSVNYLNLIQIRKRFLVMTRVKSATAGAETCSTWKSSKLCSPEGAKHGQTVRLLKKRQDAKAAKWDDPNY